jgi:hypothetical protein
VGEWRGSESERERESGRIINTLALAKARTERKPAFQSALALARFTPGISTNGKMYEM